MRLSSGTSSPRTLLLVLLAGGLLVSGCTSTPRATQKPETDLVGEPPPRRAKPQKSTVEQPTETEPPPAEEEIRVELVMLEEGNPYVTESGVKIALESVKPARIAFETAEDSQSVSIAATTTYAEGQAFGSTWSFTRDGGMHMEWRPAEGPPLTPEQAQQLAQNELDANLGCEGEQSVADSFPGTLKVERTKDGNVTCSATVGLYTRQIVTP